MPAFIVHTLLAARVLDLWRAAPETAPFPLDRVELRDAFLTGSIGPDMGMFPGGEALIADLAHYSRSGALMKALIAQSASDLERAFALGWGTHVVADALVHPLVNLAAGEARRGEPLTFADDPSLHLAFEIGVDGASFAAWRQAGLEALPPVAEGLVRFVKRVYDDVYGDVFDESRVAKTFHAWYRWQGLSIALASDAAARLYHGDRGPWGCHEWTRIVVRMATGALFRTSPLFGLTHPQRPSERTSEKFDALLTALPERFASLQRAGFADWPDYNLDTGRVEPADAYPPARRTEDRLAEALAARRRSPA